MKFTHCLLSALFLFPTANLPAQHDEARGVYFYKNTYTPSALPRFEEAKAELPSPIWDENPEWVELYWKACGIRADGSTNRIIWNTNTTSRPPLFSTYT